MPDHGKVPLIYVGDYSAIESQQGGGLAGPEWSSDSYLTPDLGAGSGRITFASYVVPPGQRIGRFYYCDDLGRIFEEDETDTVAYDGTAIVVPAYFNGGDYGGSDREGKRITRIWSYVVSEDSAWTFRLWPGGEYAFVPDESLNQPLGTSPTGFSNYAVPGYVDNVAASRSETYPTTYLGVAGRRLRNQPKTVHTHITDGKPAAGRGFIFEYRFTNPVGVEFLGLGGVFEPGDTSRGIYTVEWE